MYITTNVRVMGPSLRSQICAPAKKYAGYVLAAKGIDPLANITVGSVPVSTSQNIKPIELGDLNPIQETLVFTGVDRIQSTPAFTTKLQAFSNARRQVLQEMGYDPNSKQRIEFSDSERIQYKNKMSPYRFSCYEVHLRTRVKTLVDGKEVDRAVSSRAIYCLKEDYNNIITSIKNVFSQQGGITPEQAAPKLKGNTLMERLLSEMGVNNKGKE